MENKNKLKENGWGKNRMAELLSDETELKRYSFGVNLFGLKLKNLQTKFLYTEFL